MDIDWNTWLVQVVLPFLAVVLPVLAMWIKRKFEQRSDERDDTARRNIETALQAAAALLTKNKNAATAKAYVTAAVPDAIKRLDVSDARIPMMIESRAAMSEEQKTALLNQQQQGPKP